MSAGPGHLRRSRSGTVDGGAAPPVLAKELSEEASEHSPEGATRVTEMGESQDVESQLSRTGHFAPSRLESSADLRLYNAAGHPKWERSRPSARRNGHRMNRPNRYFRLGCRTFRTSPD